MAAAALDMPGAAVQPPPSAVPVLPAPPADTAAPAALQPPARPRSPRLPASAVSASGQAKASLAVQGIDPETATELVRMGIPITSPAAMQYFSASPRRPQVHFGNYLLLQTLGEGEFGKVKLGVHQMYGEEVAVKLIRRDRVPHTSAAHPAAPEERESQRLSKIDREIQVLRSVRHPNIVRLYEVVKSDRYIGIVLEHASGASN